jgi:ribonucleotide reductase beta subunit family protein with ferritin-like domain
VDWTKYGVDKAFDVLNMVPGLGIISSFLGTGVDFFLDCMSDIWNIEKQNAEITRDNEANVKYVDYLNMVNRIRKEREDKMNAFYDKQTAEVHRQAVEAENAFKKSVHHEENSNIEALLFHREDEFSEDQRMQITGNMHLWFLVDK